MTKFKRPQDRRSRIVMMTSPIRGAPGGSGSCRARAGSRAPPGCTTAAASAAPARWARRRTLWRRSAAAHPAAPVQGQLVCRKVEVFSSRGRDGLRGHHLVCIVIASRRQCDPGYHTHPMDDSSGCKTLHCGFISSDGPSWRKSGRTMQAQPSGARTCGQCLCTRGTLVQTKLQDGERGATSG